jgi:hypothetical protein
MKRTKKVKDPAVLRTIDMFSGKTVIEEAEAKLEAEVIEQEEATARAYSDPTAMAEHAEETAIRWLGLDAFHEGDDVKVAEHKAGHAVIVFVNTSGPNKAAHSTATFKLTRQQWSKLKQIVRES